MAAKTEYSESKGKQQVQILLSNIKNLLVSIIESYSESEKFTTQRFYDADGYSKALEEFPYFFLPSEDIGLYYILRK